MLDSISYCDFIYEATLLLQSFSPNAASKYTSIYYIPFSVDIWFVFRICFLSLSLLDFIYIFLERGKGEKKREKDRCAWETSIHCLIHPPNWRPVCNPVIRPDLESNPQPFNCRNPLSHTSPGRVCSLNASANNWCAGPCKSVSRKSFSYWCFVPSW